MPEGLYYEAELPLRWQAAEAGQHLAADLHAEDNRRVLDAVSVLEEYHGDSEAASTMTMGTMTHEIARLDAKLDLLLVVLGKLLRQQAPLPPAVRLRLSASALTWIAAEPPPDGQTGWVSLYLNELVPEPLTLPGRATSVLAEGGERWVEVRFAELPAGLQDSLEKHVFRHHRRAIAEARQPER